VPGVWRYVAPHLSAQGRKIEKRERTVSQFAHDIRPSARQAEIARRRRARRVKREVRRAFRRVRDQGLDSSEALRVVAEEVGVEQRTLLEAMRLTYRGMSELPPRDGGYSK
jgi:pilus assembly protein TadC